MAIVRWRARALGLRCRGCREPRVPGAWSKRTHRAARGPDGVHRDGRRLEWTGASQDGFAAAGRRSLLACRVGGWGTGGRLSPASVRGPSGGRGRCGHVHSLRTERDGAVSRRYGARSGTTRSKASQRVGGDDTDTSLAAEGRRRNISPLDRERSRAAGHGRGEFAGWPNVLGHSPRASFDTNCRVA
jgi:hypothetical protein